MIGAAVDSDPKEKQRLLAGQRETFANQHTKKSTQVEARLPQGANTTPDSEPLDDEPSEPLIEKPKPSVIAPEPISKSQIKRLEVQRAPQARDKASAVANVAPRYVQDAKKISEKSPELLAQVRSGEKTIPEAKREIRKAAVKAQLEDIAVQEVKAASEVYDVIVCDPP